jgi:hypothetical protein
MFIHNVYFWLKDGASEADATALAQGLESLVHDPAARGGHYGVPAATEREVVDSSYDFGLVLVFEDQAGHDRYQVGEVHKAFLAAHAEKWARVQVYDIAVDD